MKIFALSILIISLVSLSSAVVDLSGQSGKDVLNSIQTGSGLWNWGSEPMGHVVDDNELISGVRKDPRDISSMETPLQAQGVDKSGLIAPLLFSGFDDMSPLDQKSYKPSPGVFDSVFKAPSEAEFPKVY